MSQIGQVNVNFNNPSTTTDYIVFPKALIVGVSQRGPIYKVVEIDSVQQFIIAFGQPTNKYEFDFFEAVKSTVENGGIALCYRIPYVDDKDFSKPMEFYIVDHAREKLNYNFAFRDRVTYIEYVLRVKDKNVETGLYLIKNTDPDVIVVDSIVIKGDDKFYRMYVSNGKVYADLLPPEEEPEDAFLEFYVFNEDETANYYIDFHDNNVTVDKVGLYLYNGDEEESAEVNFDVIYKSSKYIDINYDNGAKLTFNLINDFNSALIIKDKNKNRRIDYDETITDISAEISADDMCYTGLKADIDPSEILGVFPVFFAPRDAENLRNYRYEDLYPFNKSDPNANRIDIFNTYVCQSNNSDEPYKINTEDISNGLFMEFERDNHFKHNWIEREVANLIDEFIPRDTDTCSNTVGVAFFGIYLTDEHKLDYILLESYYGLVGTSNRQFKNIEDLINKNSKFFRVSIDGEVKANSYVRALSKDSFIEDRNNWIVPFFAPTPYDGPRNIVDMESIFADEPTCKYNPPHTYSLPKLFNKLEKTEFLNSVPFDYILAPGLADIMMLEQFDNIFVTINPSSLAPYNEYKVNLTSATNGDEISYNNVKCLYKLLALGTKFGDKGTIAFIDVPEAFNNKFIEEIKQEDNDKTIANKISILDNILPKIKGSIGEIYNRTYPLYNYQYSDKDKRLTRYHRFRPLRKFEIVPGSSIVVGAYTYCQTVKQFYPIAGQRTSDLFFEAHKALTGMTNPQLFKVLFDKYGITSIINNKDNQTFPIQQTTWMNSYSVLKQLHAFRIYVELRRRAYGIVKSYLYEPNIKIIRNKLASQLNYLLTEFKDRHYIDSNSYAIVSADISDIEAHQVQVEMLVGIYGAIVKIIVNMNLQDMTIEVSQ